MLGSPEGRAGNSDATEVDIDDLFLGLARHVPALVHTLRHLFCTHRGRRSEAESKEKHGVWDAMAELTVTVTSPYVDSRVDSNTFTMDNSMPDPTLSPSQGLGLRIRCRILRTGSRDRIQIYRRK